MFLNSQLLDKSGISKLPYREIGQIWLTGRSTLAKKKEGGQRKKSLDFVRAISSLNSPFDLHQRRKVGGGLFPGSYPYNCIFSGKDGSMAPSIGVNLRVTGHCNQGGRKYMEDVFSVAYQQGSAIQMDGRSRILLLSPEIRYFPAPKD